jgi:hypothetical protein
VYSTVTPVVGALAGLGARISRGIVAGSAAYEQPVLVYPLPGQHRIVTFGTFFA